MAWLAAVNESVWEHLKLAFWPGLAWAAAEYFVFGREVQNFWFGKASAFLLTPAAIIALFSGYTAILGRNLLALDISVFIVAVALGQYLSYRVLTGRPVSAVWRRSAPPVVVLLAAAFALLTYFAPRNSIFMDPLTNGYGLKKTENTLHCPCE